nr:MAG TPA: peptidase [Microviridae sp.]
MNRALLYFLDDLLQLNFHFTITSALRTEAQNKAAGGVSNSQHLIGEAIDLKPYGSTTYNQLLSFIMDNVAYDQFITYDGFMHISFGPKNRHQHIEKRK